MKHRLLYHLYGPGLKLLFVLLALILFALSASAPLCDQLICPGG